MTEKSPEEIRQLAQYAKDNGMHVKYYMLVNVAKQIELYEPVIQALDEMEKSEEEFSREKVQSRIDELDGVES